MNLHHWHYAVMIELKKQEINRKLEHARLRQEAGLAPEPGWLSRIAAALRNLVKPHRKNLQEQQPDSRQPYRSVNDKLA